MRFENLTALVLSFIGVAVLVVIALTIFGSFDVMFRTARVMSAENCTLNAGTTCQLSQTDVTALNSVANGSYTALTTEYNWTTGGLITFNTDALTNKTQWKTNYDYRVASGGSTASTQVVTALAQIPRDWLTILVIIAIASICIYMLVTGIGGLGRPER